LVNMLEWAEVHFWQVKPCLLSELILEGFLGLG
jgi:hypothetical protein